MTLRGDQHVRHFVIGQVGDIRGLLYTNVLQAKLELKKHLKESRLIPRTGAKMVCYIAKGS